MKKLSVFMFCLATIMPLAATAELERFAAYRALPVDPDEVDADQRYSLIQFAIPEALSRIEAGTAWEVMVKLKNGETETHLATMMCHWRNESNSLRYLMETEASPGTLFMLIPHTDEELADSVGYLLSHDHRLSFSFGGEALVYGLADETPWNLASPLPRISKAISGKEVLAIYEPAMREELVALENFSMSEQLWDLLWEQESGFGIIVQSGITGATVGIIGTPLAGLVVGSVSLVSRALMDAGTPDLDHPEYSCASARKFEFRRPSPEQTPVAAK